ncbi:MAG TPA: hypothetical protein VLU43_08285 [Anaeromyxobacteraceae bacterium]|nr:hypothetical protein [Anaeromyxobacteraceae bacterium]
MARRSVRVLALAALTGALGCQDYNFNPVGHCLIQPGTKRVTLSSVSTADILFVVDDSGSMAGEQQNLANNFHLFVQALTDTNDQRIAVGLEPIDFHIAVTTSSVFYNPTVATCSSTCPGQSGLVCCNSSNQPLRLPRRCPSGGGCSAGNSCRQDCTGYAGEPVCCPGASTAPETYVVTCSAAGTPCGNLTTRFTQACTPVSGQGVAHAVGDKYPQGDFVAAANNPRVIHFDAALYKEADPQRGIDIQARITQFQYNVNVGTCGSGQEQHLQGGRLAIQKALAGQQKESDGSAAQWPHPNAKMVVVYVGDEDDCSSPQDPVLGVVQSGSPGSDTCATDPYQRRWNTTDFVSYLASVRPSSLLGAGVIASDAPGSCHTDAATGQPVCQAGFCCDTGCTGNVNVCSNSTCGGQGAGTRLFDFASQVSALGSEAVDGSICSDFSTVLGQLAEIVKPPSVLKLPTTPASDEVVVVRIASSGGLTRNICTFRAPLGASTPTYQAAVDAGYQWWFATGESNPTPSSVTTRYVYINHLAGTCEANPGETYSADYLGLVPDGGCGSTADCDLNPGPAGAWNCCIGVDPQGNCQPPTASIPVGSCLCKGTSG